MLFRFSLIFFAGLVLWCTACKDAPKNPETPEQVARKWQMYIDNNEFDKAKAISTARTQLLIDMMASILFEDAEEVLLPPTEFLEMVCSERQDSASCAYTINEDGELIKDSFLLVRVKDQWYVDLAEEEPSIEDDEAAEMFEEFEKMLNETVENGDTSLLFEE